ncbi:unnamed protein product [Sphagnum jensenii]|uniref:Encoded protein n=1 Tax=Sphagnum jensenii TaxID=128206 RepID=A0ABP1ATP9_9BRYO
MPFPKVVDDDHFHDAHASKFPSLRVPGSSLRKMLFYRRILSKTMTTNRPIVDRTDKSILPTIVECASCGKKAKNARLPVAARNATKNREADIESAADNDPDHVRGFLMLNVELQRYVLTN